MRQRAGMVAVLVAVLTAVSALAGCQSSPVRQPAAQAPTPLPSGPPPLPRACVFETCHQTLGTSAFTVDVPARWNGTLLLWVPGYVGVRPDHATPPRSPLPAMSAAARRLFDQGYGVAQATYLWGGWSVAQSVTAAEDAYRWVRLHVGVPQRVYTWGVSMGGLVSALLAERHPDWVSGAAPTCGVLGGTTGLYDLAVDALYGIHMLLDPRLPIGGYRTWTDAARAYARGRQTVLRAAAGTPRQRAAVLLIADLLHAAPAAGAVDLPFQVSAAAQALLAGLQFGTYGRWEVSHEFGGEFATNVGVDYAGRLDTTERALVDRLAPGLAAQALRRLGAGGRVAAVPAARAMVGQRLDPTGRISQPVVTLHDALDPVAPLEHEGAYGALAASRGQADHLMQLVTVPADGWTGSGPPQFGVGHCRFTTDETVGVITALNTWVTTGVRPGAEAVREAFGGDGGVRSGYPIPPWTGAR